MTDVVQSIISGSVTSAKIKAGSVAGLGSSLMIKLASALAEESRKRKELDSKLAEEISQRKKAEREAEVAGSASNEQNKSRVRFETELNEERRARNAAEDELALTAKTISDLEAAIVNAKALKAKDDVEHAKALSSAEERQRVVEVAHERTTASVDSKGIVADIMARIGPLLGKQKRGSWDFEIVRGKDSNRIERVIARPRI